MYLRDPNLDPSEQKYSSEDATKENQNSQESSKEFKAHCQSNGHGKSPLN